MQMVMVYLMRPSAVVIKMYPSAFQHMETTIKFTNVSRELLYVFADTDGDGQVERIPLFSDPLFTYYWDYLNTGLKLAQLRFYDISTNINTP